jgi:NitT/TauT family transport system permease protein
MSDSAYDILLGGRSRGRRPLLFARRTLYVVAPVLVAAGVVLIWQLWVKTGGISTQILPAPSTVGARIWDHQDSFFHAAKITIKESVLGLGIATGFGVLCALLIVALRPIRLTLYPILVASQVVPKIAIAPLIFIWFGLTDTSRTIIVVLLCFFPVVISCVAGLDSIEPAKLHLANSAGAGMIKTFLKIRIPQALPDFFGGLKLAATLAVSGAFVAEFLSGGEGISQQIFLASYQRQPDITLAGVAYLVVIGLVLFYIVTFAERLLIPWHISVRTSRRSR